jgi:hypothetical protein
MTDYSDRTHEATKALRTGAAQRALHVALAAERKAAYDKCFDLLTETRTELLALRDDAVKRCLEIDEKDAQIERLVEENRILRAQIPRTVAR